jgi:hypothetical protein
MSPADFRRFADAEAVVAGWIRSTVAGSRVYSSVPNTPTYPLVTVARTGGIAAERHYLDQARIDVNVWGNSKTEAHDLAALCRAAVHNLEGQIVTGQEPAFVSGVDDAVGLTWLPDQVTARDRYVFSVLVYLRPEPFPTS